jgi:nucleotide-binding universal stress UspA family protein
MSYKSLLVHLEAGEKNAAVLAAAVSLAERFSASVIGFAACQPTQIVYNDGYVSGDVIEAEYRALESSLAEAETEFRAAFANRTNRLEWRSCVTLQALHEYLAEEARGADLIVTAATPGGLLRGWTRHANNGDLVMLAGKPVLVVPEGGASLNLDHVVVGWKDTREARRAVSDALPLLAQADDVAVVEIAHDQADAAQRVDEVARWLRLHGVNAQALAPEADGDDAGHLERIAEARHAELLVTGAYGHSRLREWALGGVTRSLLHRPGRYALLSH